MKHPVVMFTTCWLALVSLSGCTDESQQSETKAPVEVSAHTMTLAATALPVHYHTSGAVSSDHKVSISSRLSGYIRSIKLREGDRVKSGQLLFDVDPVNARQAYAQAKADLADAESDMKRYRSLLAEHAVSQQQYDKVRLRYVVAQSRVVQAENQLQYAEVRSPVNGIVVEKHASSGDLATPGQPLLVLEDPSSLLVETYVSEQFVATIHENDAVRIFIPGLAKTIDGHIRQIVKSADRLSHQFLVKVALSAESGAYPGMFAEVNFSVGERQAIVVPGKALLNRSGLSGIYVMDKQGLAHYRQLRTGEQTDKGIEVLAGLEAGDVIAWRDDGALRSGVRIKAE
ncbi:efflux RND transporter periplasmic adaptor subunit [Mariprofundus ferrooxydans]|uniref:efflux RND transporter periplasmic adaptor subunit n=1 Tax=Mariprofundus ferrooxydans TaxID=314344 RepID=UPI00036F77F7|nr:efflux RND transporter periplasmic adaptor subunit [Mariprofundus ferrooxydans]